MVKFEDSGDIVLPGLFD